MTTKGRLLSTCPMLKAFSTEKGPQNGGFGGKRGVKRNFWFCDPQKTRPCAEPRHLTYFESKSVRASWL